MVGMVELDGTRAPLGLVGGAVENELRGERTLGLNRPDMFGDCP